MPIFKLLYCYIVKLLNWLIIKNNLTISERKRAITIQQFNNGFSLIELLIVITVLGLTASLITASFLTFERNNRTKNAAAQLKNDLRLTQNNALSGNKGVNGGTCNPVTPSLPPPFLVGWFLTLDASAGSNDRYVITGDCNVSGTEQPFNQKTIAMPSGVKISSFYFNNNCADPPSSLPVDILFEPLKNGVTFHNSVFTPPFYNANGRYSNQLSAGSPLCIKLARDSSIYKVIIQPTGEINESKP